MQTKISARDFFINLGAIAALYTVVASLLSLLFTVINEASPAVGEYYYGTASISWPVATLIVFFPIFIVLMRILEKDYNNSSDNQSSGIHKFLSYLTLFLAGLMLAIDLITALYYFLDGRDMTTGFLLKVLSVLLVGGLIFSYYLSNITGKLTAQSRNIYRIIAVVVVLGSIFWGFAVLGSPNAQRMYKYDEEKVSDLMQINNQISSYYASYETLPESLNELTQKGFYVATDEQTGGSYEYIKTGNLTYNLCAVFNKASRDSSISIYPYGKSWTHVAGRDCFSENINPSKI